MHAWIDARGLKKAAVTNAPRANTMLMLEALGLSSYFEAVVLGEECARAKPHPDPYLKGLEVLGLTADETIVIEDSPAGLAAAVAAGIPAVGILTGQSQEALVAAGACHIISDYHELLELTR
jgi:HAD superfamily hydrolase (TIGR01509 family)